jgi:hypothetical protein
MCIKIALAHILTRKICTWGGGADGRGNDCIQIFINNKYVILKGSLIACTYK